MCNPCSSSHMKPYPAYKDSGTEWLGEIPECWEVRKLKFCDEVIMGQSPNSEDYNTDFVGLPFLQGNADFNLLYPKPRIWCDTANKIAEVNDILLSVRAPIGAINIADQKYGIGRGLCAIRSSKTYKKYLYYTALCLHDELNSLGTGSTFTAVSVDKIKNLTIPHPPLPEQRTIAAFLDHKTRLIDTYIAKKQQQIERLLAYRTTLINQAVTKGLNPDAPMKDSGIEWLGEIPAGWTCAKLKHIANFKSGDSITSTDIDKTGQFPVYGGNGIRGYTNKYTHNGNFILIGRQGALCGNIHYAKGYFWASEHAIVVYLQPSTLFAKF
jgi:type I restriction enzyme S subunit